MQAGMFARGNNGRFIQAAPMWLLLLSLFDAFATDMGIRMDAVHEKNPFAAMLYEASPAIFYICKLILPLLLFVLLRYIDSRSFIFKLLYATTILYGALAVYHLVWIIMKAYAIVTNIG